MTKVSEKLGKEFNYYLANQGELVKKYPGRFIAIRGNKVVDDYPTELEAYNDCVEKYELGTFLIQECSPGDASYTQHFQSRIVF